jgi:outer membrane protein OmpA-like peptidoglycan-associated protein
MKDWLLSVRVCAGLLVAAWAGSAVAQADEKPPALRSPSGAAQVDPSQADEKVVAGETQAPNGQAATDKTPADKTSADTTPVDKEPAGVGLHSTIGGATGGMYVHDARTAAQGVVRFQLVSDFFYDKEFLQPSDGHRRLGGTVSAAWGITDFLELYGSVAAHSNRNRSEQSDIIAGLGDVETGLRAGFGLNPWLFFGGGASVLLPNTMGNVGPIYKGLGGTLGLNLTADARRTSAAFPLIGRLNLAYRLDNSAGLVENTEQRRYDALSNPDPVYADETANLVTRVERYALGMNRVDQFQIRVGTEWPIKVADRFFVQPLAEWSLGVPVNRQQYTCMYEGSVGDPSRPPAGDDGCLAEQGFKSYPQFVTLGARVLPPVDGLSILAGANLGLTGTNTFVRELSPTPVYSILIGVGYSTDGLWTKIRQLRREANAPAPAPAPEGVVEGLVVDSETNEPVQDAVVDFVGRGRTPLHASQGRFVSYSMPPGVVSMELSHPDYHAETCQAQIPDQGGPVRVTCVLKPKPRMGEIAGHVTDAKSKAAVAGVQVELTGPASYRTTSDAQGAISLLGVQPGSYQVRVQDERYFVFSGSVAVQPRVSAPLEVVLEKRPEKSSIVVSDKEIVLKKQVHFANNSAEILPDSQELVHEIADALARNPQIRKVEIQGHTDNRGKRERNMTLSQERAQSVRNALVASGVDPARLVAKGYGPDKPTAPNITARNRARNRRVQLIILQD